MIRGVAASTGAQWLAACLALLLMVVADRSVARDYRTRDDLSSPTVATVWAAYVLHAVVVFWISSTAPLGRLPIPASLAHIGGGFLAGVGAWIAFESVVTFRSFARMSGRDTTRLVTWGIYRFSRNPQNVGWCLALLGIALMGRSSAALALTLLFAGVVHRYIVRLEEPYLARIHGEEYRRYASGTSRYFGVPRPGPA